MALKPLSHYLCAHTNINNISAMRRKNTLNYREAILFRLSQVSQVSQPQGAATENSKLKTENYFCPACPKWRMRPFWFIWPQWPQRIKNIFCVFVWKKLGAMRTHETRFAWKLNRSLQSLKIIIKILISIL